jgi:3-isopropylmalate/(R)-2-methylmalate dehydratase small subunit
MNKDKQVFEPLATVSARAAMLPGPNMDTDQIIPARFLKKDRAKGYGQYLFFDARFDEQDIPRPAHPLNAAIAPKILVVEDNFGCGSSREGAVYALADFGVRVIVGTTFGDIFHNNCFKNGVLPIRLSAKDHQALSTGLVQPRDISIDLPAQMVDWGTGQASFAIDAFWKECLTKGLDELSLTLSYQADIDRFEQCYRANYPWLVPTN